jgi:hypothetical protein
MFFSSPLHAKHPYLKEMKEEHEVFLGIVCGHSFAAIHLLRNDPNFWP